MDKKALKRIIIFVVVLTLISFITPWLFTRPAFCDCLVFEGKGEIGDVIGGIWGSAIALIGVGVTFLAFWIQKKANDIQIAQFKETQQADRDYKDAEAKNRVMLMREDVRYMIFDLERQNGWMQQIQKYKEEIESDYYACNTLKRTALDNYERIKSTPRIDLFAALNRMGYDEPDKLIYSFFSASDFLSVSLNEIAQKSDKYSKDIYEYSKKILGIFKSDNDQLVLSINGFFKLGLISYTQVQEFLTACNEEFTKNNINNPTDVTRLVSLAKIIQPILEHWPANISYGSEKIKIVSKLEAIRRYDIDATVAMGQQLELLDLAKIQFDEQIAVLKRLEELLNQKL